MEYERVLLIGGSLDGSLPLLPPAVASELAALFRQQRWTAVWCGMSTGLAGRVIEELLDTGGRAEAVVVNDGGPQDVPESATKIVVADFHERARELYKRGQAVVVLPGGLGTLSELTQLVAWNAAGLYRCPIVVLDPSAWFAGVREYFKSASAAGASHAHSALFASTVVEVREFLQAKEKTRKPSIPLPLFVRARRTWVDGGHHWGELTTASRLPEAATAVLRTASNVDYFRSASLSAKEEVAAALCGDWAAIHSGARGYVEPGFTKSRFLTAALMIAATSGTKRSRIEKSWAALQSERPELKIPDLPMFKAVAPASLLGVALARFALLVGKPAEDAHHAVVLDALASLATAAGCTGPVSELLLALAQRPFGPRVWTPKSLQRWEMAERRIRRVLAISVADGDDRPYPWEPGHSLVETFKQLIADPAAGVTAFLAGLDADPILNTQDPRLGVLMAARTFSRTAERTLAHVDSLVSTAPLSSAARSGLTLPLLSVLNTDAACAYACASPLLKGEDSESCLQWLAANVRRRTVPAAIVPHPTFSGATRILPWVPYWDACRRLALEWGRPFEWLEKHPDAPAPLGPAGDEPRIWELGAGLTRWRWLWETGDSLPSRLDSEISSGTSEAVDDGPLWLAAAFFHQRPEIRAAAWSKAERCVGAQGFGPLWPSEPQGEGTPGHFEVTMDFLARRERGGSHLFAMAAMVFSGKREVRKMAALQILVDTPRSTLPVQLAAHLLNVLPRESASIRERAVAPMELDAGHFAWMETRNAWTDNVAGSVVLLGRRYRFFVDKECVLCSVCSDAAPRNFGMSDEEDHSICLKQPEDAEELAECQVAMANCPVESLREEGLNEHSAPKQEP